MTLGKHEYCNYNLNMLQLLIIKWHHWSLCWSFCGGWLAISEQKDSFKFTSKLFFFTEYYSAHSC